MESAIELRTNGINGVFPSATIYSDGSIFAFQTDNVLINDMYSTRSYLRNRSTCCRDFHDNCSWKLHLDNGLLIYIEDDLEVTCGTTVYYNNIDNNTDLYFIK